LEVNPTTLPIKIGERPGSPRDFIAALPIKMSASHVRTGLGALLIFALVFLVYAPILPGTFLMDDHRLIKEDNALVTGEMSPLTFWFQTDFTLSAVTWWLQWLAWGDSPGGYHAVNIALHGLSAVLLWRLLARLKIPGAWLAAALFAVHPVCVNSVARIAELKNTLSLPFFILSFWAYLKHETFSLDTGDRSRQNRGAIWYGLSLVAFVLALLSKTSTVMLPAVLLACAMWQRRRVTREDWLHTGPFFILALAFGLMSVWFQKHQALADAGQTLPPGSFLDRLTGAGHVICFYLGKALVPANLNLVYAHWGHDATTVIEFLPILFLGAGFALCWRFRHTWGWHILFGLGCFIITLFPVLGFFDSQFLTVWQVSDHLQYLPLMAPVALAAAGLFVLLKNKPAFRYASIVLVLVLSVLTFQRARVFASEESLFQDAIKKNPTASSAHNDLGVILAKRRDFAGANRHFSAALESDPQNTSAHLNYGQALAMTGHFAEAEPHFLAAIRLQPDNPLAHKTFANALHHQGRVKEAIPHFQTAVCLGSKPDVETRMDLAGLYFQTGQSRRAVEQFRKVRALKPDMPDMLNNLAWLLATCSDDTLRDGKEAVECAERACRLTMNKQTAYIGTLAAAYAEAGRFPEAVDTAKLAIDLQNANGETQYAAITSQLLQLYSAGRPFHSPPAPGQSP
jgi:Flp pilus assembly protein TadD